MMLFLISIFMLQAKAEDLSLPDKFFRNSAIESRHVVKVDQCTRIKSDKKLFLIKAWEENLPTNTVVVSKKKKKRTKASLAQKVDADLNATLSELVRDHFAEHLMIDDCEKGLTSSLAGKFGKELNVICGEGGKFSTLIPKVKELKTDKPIIVLSSQLTREEFVKINQEEKWDCEVYEPKSFKKMSKIR